MPYESLLWGPLTKDNVTGLKDQAPILAVRADGKGYYGQIIDVTPEYVELANGSQRQILRFFDSPTQFAIITAPPFHQRKLAERSLFKKDTSNGPT